MKDEYKEEMKIELIDLCKYKNVPDVFDVGNASIMNYYRNVALFDHVMKMARTKVIESNGKVVGFYTLSSMNVTLENLNNTEDPNNYSCVSLQWLGVNVEDQGKGIGSTVLEYIVSQGQDLSKIIGFRCFYIEAVIDKVSWYTDRGFQFIDDNDEQRIINGSYSENTVAMVIDYREEDALESLC